MINQDNYDNSSEYCSGMFSDQWPIRTFKQLWYFVIGLDSTPRDPNLILAWLLASRSHNTNWFLTFASVELSRESLFQVLNSTVQLYWRSILIKRVRRKYLVTLFKNFMILTVACLLVSGVAANEGTNIFVSHEFLIPSSQPIYSSSFKGQILEGVVETNRNLHIGTPAVSNSNTIVPVTVSRVWQ